MLHETHPHLIVEWHVKNLCHPHEVSRGSDTKIWWQCPKHDIHVYKAAVKCRTGSGKKKPTGCPFCSGRFVCDTNSLASRAPHIAKDWDYSKNKHTPDNVTVKSNKKVWWQCESGHSWKATVCNRTSRNRGCPYCANQKVWEGNNLAYRYPHIAKEWDNTRNGCLKPTEIMPGSKKRVWWCCQNGHSWETTVHQRTGKIQSGCPYCAGKRATPTNNLKVLNNELAREWHPTKNGALAPQHVCKSSGHKVWWKCQKGHEWEATVNNRARGRGCPQCSLNGCSKKQIEWLNRIARQKNISIKHKLNGGEVKIRGLKVDGYCEESNTIYEYLGCFWHGHPPELCHSRRKYPPDQINRCCKRKYSELYEKTLDRLEAFRNDGFHVVSIWGCQYVSALNRKRRSLKKSKEITDFRHQLFS